MSINEMILTELSRRNLLYEYGCRKSEISDFISNYLSFGNRQEQAIRIIEGILTDHGKKELLESVTELARVESGIKELEPWVRDHVVHAVLTFLLGIYLNELFFDKYIRVNNFQWKLAGLLHDVGYPIQIGKDVLQPFGNNINQIVDKLGIKVTKIKTTIRLEGLENLPSGQNSFEIIQRRIDQWEILIDASSEHEIMVQSGNVCHGIISSLAILYVLDAMYTKYNPHREFRDVIRSIDNTNWNQEYFEEDVVSACTAIFIHNLPSRCFTRTKINRARAPLAFLLKLSDSLQDWDRPSYDNRGIPATNFNINITNNRLNFSADVNEEEKRKLQHEIFSCLDASDILII